MKLNIIYVFNRLRIIKGDKWLTAFRTQYGLFEYLVMLFGLVNALSSFQYFVNDTLRPYLDIFCTKAAGFENRPSAKTQGTPKSLPFGIRMQFQPNT